MAGQVSGFINYSISIGDVMTIAGIVIAAGGVVSRISDRLARMDTKLEPLWEDFTSRMKKGRE